MDSSYSDPTSGTKVTTSHKMRPGHTYFFKMLLTPKDGYIFNEHSVVVTDGYLGEKISTIVNNGSLWVYYMITVDLDAPKLIATENVSIPKVGDSVEFTLELGDVSDVHNIHLDLDLASAGLELDTDSFNIPLSYTILHPDDIIATKDGSIDIRFSQYLDERGYHTDYFSNTILKFKCTLTDIPKVNNPTLSFSSTMKNGEGKILYSKNNLTSNVFWSLNCIYVSVTEPVVGKTPSYTAGEKSGKFSVIVDKWKVHDLYSGFITDISSTSVFRACRKYRVEVTISPKPTDKNQTFVINGVIASRGNNGIYYVDFDELPGTWIDSFDVQIPKPVVGEKPSYDAMPVDVNAPYSVTVLRWYRQDPSYKALTVNDVFEAGYSYGVDLIVKANTGSTFTKNAVCTANGIEYKNLSGNTSIDVKYIDNLYFDLIGSTKKIAKVNLFPTSDDPFIYKTTGTVDVDYEPAADAYGDYSWWTEYDKNGKIVKTYYKSNRNGAGTLVRKDGYTYRYTVSVKPKKGAEFDSSVECLFNGQPAVDYKLDGNTLTMSYDYYQGGYELSGEAELSKGVGANIRVELYKDNKFYKIASTASMSKEYWIRDLAPGNYTLVATYQGYKKYVQSITITDSNLSHKIVLQPLSGQSTSSVSGTVTAPGDPNTPVNVQLMLNGWQKYSQTVTSGSYLFEGIPNDATYDIIISKTGCVSYTETINLGNKDVIRNVTLKAKSNTGGGGGSGGKEIAGDADGNKVVNVDDAIYVLYASMLPSIYPMSQKGDYNGDGRFDVEDAIYLLMHTMLPELYPLSSLSV